MKRFKYIFICLLALNILGCESYFGDNANVDPDNPGSATLNVLLPQIELRLAYTYGGDFTRYLGLNTQHVKGLFRQFVGYDNYELFPADTNTAWSNVYSGTLNSNQVMKNLAIEAEANHYHGIALVLESYAIMMATDVWGDIPYSDALRFGDEGVYAPQLDSQEDIYNAIFRNLEQARTLLEGEDGGVPIGADDLIYGAGSAANWIAFVNVLEARARLHLSKVNSNAYTEVLAALDRGGFATMGGAAGLAFGTAVSENAPWYQYIEQRGDTDINPTYVDRLNSLNDPRGATYGVGHVLPHPVFLNNQTVSLLSFSEQEFMRAEALMGTGDAAGAFEAFSAGVTASFSEATIDPELAADYIADNYGASVTMDDIMTQKHIALYTSPEAFNDWRRSGIPVLTPNTGTAIPRRWPYAEGEQFANVNIPSPKDVTVFDRVWWDN